MSLKDKLINFFTTKFSENTKYSNTLNSTLRFFFERLTNINDSFSSLGNVYKNSKWTDLKIDNIKPSFNIQFFKNFLRFLVSFTIIFFTIIFFMRVLNIEISPTYTYAHVIYDISTLYLFAIFYFIGHTSQLITCYFLNKSMKVFSKEWLIEEEKNKMQKQNSKMQDLISEMYKNPSPVLTEVVNLTQKNKNSLFYNSMLLDKNTLELIWHIERCKEQLRRVSMNIDFNSFNKKYLLVRNLDLLSDSLGGNISMETIMRVVYFDLEQSNKVKPRQDFFLLRRKWNMLRCLLYLNLQKIILI